MKTLVIVSHPQLGGSQTQSFLKEVAVPLPDVQWWPLTDGPIDVSAAQQAVRSADRIVFQFPLYWYSAPASLWAWLDAVWSGGFAYDETGGRLTGKSLGLVVNFGQRPDDYTLGGRVGQPVEAFLAPFAALAKRTGMTLMRPLLIAQFERQSLAEHQQLTTRYAQYLQLTDPFNRVAQAAWFAAGLTTRNQDLMADTLEAAQADLTQLRRTVRELRQGEDD